MCSLCVRLGEIPVNNFNILLMLCWGLLGKFFLFELTGGNRKCEIFNERV